MMVWDRITQTGARTPGVRAVPGPILRCLCWSTFPDSELERKGRPPARRVVTNWKVTRVRWEQASARGRPGRSHLTCTSSSRTEGKPAVRNDRGDGGNVGIIRSPLRATILLDCGGGLGNWPSYRDGRWRPTECLIFCLMAFLALLQGFWVS